MNPVVLGRLPSPLLLSPHAVMLYVLICRVSLRGGAKRLNPQWLKYLNKKNKTTVFNNYFSDFIPVFELPRGWGGEHPTSSCRPPYLWSKFDPEGRVSTPPTYVLLKLVCCLINTSL